MHRAIVSAVILAIGLIRADAAEVDFVRDVQPILQQHCTACHGATKQKSGLRLDIKSEAFKGGDGYGPSIVAGSSTESPLVELVSSHDPETRMPPSRAPLSAFQIETLTRWIDSGAVWPEGVDLAELEDRLDHWSFQQRRSPDVPAVGNSSWARSAVDAFVLARLYAQGLTPAPEADCVTWLRRVTLDLTGLLPTPQEVTAFQRQAGQGEQAYAAVVNRLLQSPRYGERWAQHWLDVVRYADTHGFEVNTERPNAWPYRDYVIDALNQDRPYDRFIKEQIVGDAMGEDAATGFLVTASVLLPGQIGRDAASIRLARQDALDEIVNNIGQTFLGLSVGCARCHDHKFDPIRAKDYYAMQAFVAGVEYGERPLRSPEADALRRKVQGLRQQVSEIEQQLAAFVPLARPRRKPAVDPRSPIAEANTKAPAPLDSPATNVAAQIDRPPLRMAVHPTKNIDRFLPVRARRLRFEILSTNDLEPCLDELEVFNVSGQNIAAADLGTTVTTSGDTIFAGRHEPSFLNDGEYGNARSWMSNTRGKGWVELEFPALHEVERVVWGRDREGKYTDRLATQYRIQVAADANWKLVADSTDRQPFMAGGEHDSAFSTIGLDAQEAEEANRLLVEKRRLEAQIDTSLVGQQAFAGTFRKPDDIHLLRRGDPERPAERVAPAVLSAIDHLSLSTETAEQDRRLTLADWIANPQNPLTARVMVNRIWQWHFGIGLVATPNDFGRNGADPSHPELLDWLAEAFVRSGWSIKQMHRLIVLSSTYRQSSQYNREAAVKDADVRLLWRYPSRRLEAEAIRDCMLAVSGQLNLKMGGRGYDLFNKRGGLSGFTPVESYSGEGLRRMIYAHKVRRERDAVFGAFDCPDAGQSTARRLESTTPIQALNLFNSRVTLDQAEAFASRTWRDVGDDVTAQIRRVYMVALNREPAEVETVDAESVVREHGLATLCRVLFNSNEFLFLP